ASSLVPSLLCLLFFFLMFRRLPTSTLFPYTTLFRSYYFHLKKYFTFLYSNHLIDEYPLIDLKTYKVNKYTNITLGWQQYLPEIFKIAELSDDAKLELFLISQNIEPKEIGRASCRERV